MNGRLSIESLTENGFRELFGTFLGCSVPSGNKWKSAFLNSAGDTGIEAMWQMYKNGEIDPQTLLQTAITSGLNNLLFSCDPVSCSRGNFFVYRKDYACEDLYGTWTFSRRYSSILEYTGSMGKGWLHEYELFLLCEEDGGILAILPDTHLERFVKQDGQWVNRRGGTKEYTLTEHSDHFELISWQEATYKNYTFDKVGRLMAVSEDPYSIRRTTIQYVGESGQIRTVTSPGGRVLRFRYDRNKIVEVADDTGRVLRYEYDRDCLVRAYYTTGGIQEYRYDHKGRIETMDGWDGRDFLSNQYDKQGRVICQTYPDGNTCTIDYDDRHQETWFTFSDTGRWEHYYSDDRDHVLRVERGMGEGLREQVRKLQEETGYHSPETFAAIRELEGISVESYVYDEQGNKAEHTDKNGNVARWSYDRYGRMLVEETADGHRVDYAYDRQHRMVSREDNAGQKTEYRYDARTGRKQMEICWIGEQEAAETHFVYDRFGRMLEVTDALGNTESYSYDEEGCCHNPLFYTAADGTEFSYTLDSMGRTASITSPYGTVKLSHSDTGEIVRTEDALGNVTEKMVDAIGNGLKLIPPNAYKGTIAGEEAFRYRYDYLDRRIETSAP